MGRRCPLEQAAGFQLCMAKLELGRVPCMQIQQQMCEQAVDMHAEFDIKGMLLLPLRSSWLKITMHTCVNVKCTLSFLDTGALRKPVTAAGMLALRLLGRGTACSSKSGIIESELAVLQSSIVASWRFKSTRTEKDTFGPLEVPGDK